ncbi:LamG domain-containing protein [Paenarthrobacter ureafaciens]|uniref:LamG domain-containing protein n=1 Tax=Paenarthrobacter ureafaciens TaxID=37931 RepID=UPI00140D8682|nr:LamG domain-containing protein [Paenarthrobacter ureafaciens]MCX8455865.1 LamG domain-containing protein [Paenarthrobacter ureafaciens]MCY0975411.1 LamG domain-containing protein [Paenarthrobacter ureafaciens]
MRTSFALIRRACVPVVGLSLLVAGFSMPAAQADTEPPATPAESTGSEAEAVAQAQAQATSTDVVVEDATTPTLLTVAHPDGTLTSTVDTDPVRMKTEAGWTDISTDLVRTTVNGVSVLKPENVPVDITVGTGGSDKIASLDDKKGHSLTQSWPFGTLPEPVVEGNSATFRQVLPGVDLIQLAHKTGISQVLKIETAEAAKDPRVAEMRIFLDSRNAVVEQQADGSLTAKGTDSGEVALRNTGGLWWDSSVEGATATDPGGQGVARPFSLTLGTEDGKQSQIFGMDQILETANLTFPVYVDPDWTITRANYIFVDNAYPETSYWNGNLTDGQVHVGFLPNYWAPDGVNHLARSYYQFDSSYFVGRDILAAKLNTVETWSSSCTPANVASWITDPVYSTTRWNAQPVLRMRTDMGAVAKGYNASCPAGTVGFDLMAGKSLLLNKSVWTIMLAAGNESDPLGWKKFQNSASIIVTHNSAPNTPVITTISGGKWAGTPWAQGSYYVTRNKKPTFRVWASDVDGTIGGPITVYMTVRRVSDNAIMTASNGTGGDAVGDQFDWQSGIDLANGKYYLQAQTVDSWGLHSGIMRFDFRVDTTPPAAPIITPTAGTFVTTNEGQTNEAHIDSDGVIGETLYDFQLTLPAGSEPVEGFIFSITSGSAASAYPESITCGTPRIKEYVAVCPAGGMSANIRIAALDQTTSLTVWAFDTAGNVTVPLHNQTASHYTFTVGEESATPGIIDPVTLNGQVQWATVGEFNNFRNSCVDRPGGDTGSKPQMLKVTNATSWAQTSGSAVDPNQSFSVAGWFCPTSVNTSLQDLIVQWAGTNTPAAALRIRTDAKPELVAWASSGATETVIGPNLEAGKWAFISAIYDKYNAQLRITKTDTNGTGNWVVAASPVAHRTAALTDPVKLGYGFTGNIYKPVMTQGVMKPTGFNALMVAFTDSSKGLLK